MPRTRPHLERDEKVDQLVDVAVRRLLEGGYTALSIADIARELGLAQNAIYWYFPSKDDLFVAAMQRIYEGILNRKPRSSTVATRVVWFAEQLLEVQPIRAALSERARVSAAVAKFECDVYDGIKMLLSSALSGTVPAAELGLTTDAVVGLVEGVLQQNISKKQRAELIRFGLARLANVHD
jgi:AcrR family transcriptional regulator